MICVFKNFYGVKWYEHAINLIALTVNICMLRSRHTSVTTADIGWVSIASTLFCTYLSHFSTVLDDFFFGSARQIKHPIFTGQGAGQRSHTPGMTRAIAYIQVEVVVVVASVCHWWWCHMPNLVILEMIDCIFVHKPPKPRPELRLTAWKYWSPSRGPLKPYSTACDAQWKSDRSRSNKIGPFDGIRKMTHQIEYNISDTSPCFSNGYYLISMFHISRILASKYK